MAQIEVRDRGQIEALCEHIERSRPKLPWEPRLHLLTGIPIYLDPEMPKGVLRLTDDEGNVSDFRLT